MNSVKTAAWLDSSYFELFPEVRTFMRMALPGEINCPIPPLTFCMVTEADSGAQYRSFEFPPEDYCLRELHEVLNGMVLKAGCFEDLVYQTMVALSYKKSSPFSDKDAIDLVRKGAVASFVYDWQVPAVLLE
ncbi:MAG: hypothetical protein A4E48_02752 [Methanosaeta sp. PtaU1.Bin060]|nr:MAG: hypothetical protein A4E48_02752 [Methanosaeta sp. PtaU1.Bin060]